MYSTSLLWAVRKAARDLCREQGMSRSHVTFETLENRTMMSVAPTVHAVVVKNALVKTITVPLQADPAVTDPSITYKSFADAPLFSSAGPKPDDIKQGYIGDCFFLSTLASVAKISPNIIRNDITTGADGTYTVKFMTAAKRPEYVRVDADLPVWSGIGGGGGNLAYAGLGAQGSVWVAVMEKAYAEFRTHSHSYASIDGGWMTEAFSALGLASNSVYWAANSTSLMNLVNAQVKAKHFATFATGDTITGDAPLIADHAYEIDSIQYDAKGRPVSIRLRNPWGVDGAGHDGADDGYVTITAAQMLKNMSGVVVAHA
jgi:hypothetical protein